MHSLLYIYIYIYNKRVCGNLGMTKYTCHKKSRKSYVYDANDRYNQEIFIDAFSSSL